MNTEMSFLIYTALLNGCLYIPVVVGYVKYRGFLTPDQYVTAPTSALPDWVERANRAHMNAVETFSPYAAVVIVAQLVGYSSTVTVYCAIAFFFARLAHAVVHITGFKHVMARTVIFNIAWFAFIIYAGNLLMNV